MFECSSVICCILLKLDFLVFFKLIIEKKNHVEFKNISIAEKRTKRVRDHRQVTFITLNRFCPLSNSLSPPLPTNLDSHCCWRKISRCIEYQPRLNEKCTPFLHRISSLSAECTFYKIFIKILPPVLLFLVLN